MITGAIFSVYLLLSLFDDGRKHQQLSLARLRYKVPIVKHAKRHRNKTYDKRNFKFISLHGALRARSTQSKRAVIAMFNHSTVESAVNYALHAQRSKSSNFIMLGVRKKDCDFLWALKRDIPCLPCHRLPKVDDGRLSFDQCAFYSASNAVGMGFSVTITPVENLILKYPRLPCKNCDIAFDSNSNRFYPAIFHSDPKTSTLLKHVELSDKKLSKTMLLYRVAKGTKPKPKIFDISNILPILDCNFTKSFQLKKSKNGFIWDKNCPSDKESVVYVLKELKKWMVNRNGYYSSNKAKYFMITSEIGGSGKLKKIELAFKLSDITSRILILPKFYCNCFSKKCSHGCSFWHILRSKNATMKILSNLKKSYRESSFLENTLIPTKVRKTFETAITHKTEKFSYLSQFQKIFHEYSGETVIKISSLDKLLDKSLVVNSKHPLGKG